MKSFFIFFILSRKKINENWKDLNIDKKEYEIEEIFDFIHKKKGDVMIDNIEESNFVSREGDAECRVNIEFIDFVEDIITNDLKDEKLYLRFKLLREPNEKVKDLCNYLKNSNYKNSLLQKAELQKYLTKKPFTFGKKVKIDREKFKNGQRKSIFGKDFTPQKYYQYCSH